MHFTLTDIGLSLYIGINPEEKESKQKVILTVEWDLSDSPALQTDNIGDTVDYFAVREFVKHYPKDKHFNLIEHFLHELRMELLHEFGEMENLTMELEKFPFREGGSIKAKIV
ncbi:dihydroneopterin aldolase [Candidatus Gracilibacteria bacterium]|nr:dihydroneopterin aldolase [Candidatus Gracilibacteria bacterium]